MSPAGTALLVLARDPTGPRSGRISVLETAVRSLDLLGWQVTVVALCRVPDPVAPGQWLGHELHRVPLPAPLSTLGRAAATALSPGGRSLNEALFASRRMRTAVARIAAADPPTVVIADTLRVLDAVRDVQAPLVVHVDDLLSDRYLARRAAGGTDEDLLGYFGRQLPAWLRRPATSTASRLLGIEGRRLRRRELEVARTAAGTALTGGAEAQELAKRSGQPVATLPMAVELPATTWSRPRPGDARSAVFLGSPGYAPNRRALRWWIEEVVPALAAAGAPTVALTVIGACTEEDRRELGGGGVTLAGYVEDLAAALSAYDVMVAPVRDGTGVKTKVLDGLAVGIPVVTTTLGAEGIPMQDAGWTGDTPGELAAAVLEALGTGAPARAARGPELVRRHFSLEVVSRGWADMLAVATRGT